MRMRGGGDEWIGEGREGASTGGEGLCEVAKVWWWQGRGLGLGRQGRGLFAVPRL